MSPKSIKLVEPHIFYDHINYNQYINTNYRCGCTHILASKKARFYGVMLSLSSIDHSILATLLYQRIMRSFSATPLHRKYGLDHIRTSTLTALLKEKEKKSIQPRYYERTELLTSCTATVSSLAKPSWGSTTLYCERVVAHGSAQRLSWDAVSGPRWKDANLKLVVLPVTLGANPLIACLAWSDEAFSWENPPPTAIQLRSN